MNNIFAERLLTPNQFKFLIGTIGEIYMQWGGMDWNGIWKYRGRRRDTDLERECGRGEEDPYGEIEKVERGICIYYRK